MPVLLEAISQAFSQSPPVYSNSGSTNYSTPYPTTICFPNPQVSPFPYNASTLISNAYLPFSNASISASNTFLSPTHSKFHHYDQLTTINILSTLLSHFKLRFLAK